MSDDVGSDESISRRRLLTRGAAGAAAVWAAPVITSVGAKAFAQVGSEVDTASCNCNVDILAFQKVNCPTANSMVFDVLIGGSCIGELCSGPSSTLVTEVACNNQSPAANTSGPVILSCAPGPGANQFTINFNPNRRRQVRTDIEVEARRTCSNGSSCRTISTFTWRVNPVGCTATEVV